MEFHKRKQGNQISEKKINTNFHKEQKNGKIDSIKILQN